MTWLTQNSVAFAPSANADPIGAIPGVHRIGDDALVLLADLFRQYEWTDPYCGSAAYFGLTGRHGLWLAIHGDAFMPLCRHPNEPDRLLLFPPTGNDGQALLRHVVWHLPPMAKAPHLARFPVGKSSHALAAFEPHGAGQAGAREKKLDWRYPVHVLSTEAVARHRGHAFKDFRHNINRAAAHGITSETLHPRRHRGAIERIACDWSRGQNGLSPEAAAEPYLRLLDLFAHLPTNGRLHRIDGKPVGFAIWEETDPTLGIANSFADLTDGQTRGLSEYVLNDMAETLAVSGYRTVCIGGSETASLDAFKRKMQPIRSVALSTVTLPPRGRNPLAGAR